jgi:hypothetical protein
MMRMNGDGRRMMSYNHNIHDDHPTQKTKDGAWIVDNTAFTVEWILSSPPPLHAFEEPPIIVEWPIGEDTSGGH